MVDSGNEGPVVSIGRINSPSLKDTTAGIEREMHKLNRK